MRETLGREIQEMMLKSRSRLLTKDEDASRTGRIRLDRPPFSNIHLRTSLRTLRECSRVLLYRCRCSSEEQPCLRGTLVAACRLRSVSTNAPVLPRLRRRSLCPASQELDQLTFQ